MSRSVSLTFMCLRGTGKLDQKLTTACTTNGNFLYFQLTVYPLSSELG